MNIHHLSRSNTLNGRSRGLTIGPMKCSNESDRATTSTLWPAGKSVSILDLTWPLYGLTRVIRIGEALSLNDHHDFSQAYTEASSLVRVYVVDFSDTRRIDDSVVSMLFLLRKHVGGDREKVHLMNAGYDVRKTLGAVNINVFFTTDTNAVNRQAYGDLCTDIGLAVSAIRH